MFLKKVDLKQNPQTTEKHAKSLSMQRETISFFGFLFALIQTKLLLERGPHSLPKRGSTQTGKPLLPRGANSFLSK